MKFSKKINSIKKLKKSASYISASPSSAFVQSTLTSVQKPNVPWRDNCFWEVNSAELANRFMSGSKRMQSDIIFKFSSQLFWSPHLSLFSLLLIRILEFQILKERCWINQKRYRLMIHKECMILDRLFRNCRFRSRVNSVNAPLKYIPVCRYTILSRDTKYNYTQRHK